MIKIKDFKNAPVGTTATHTGGYRAMKIYDGKPRWITPNGNYLSDKEMVRWGYKLDQPAPTTAREALDLAWVLAHEVKEGQTIPSGTQFLMLHSSGLKAYTAPVDREINFAIAPVTRTFDPLPDPEPDWLDAPAVLAHTDNDDTRRVWTAHRDERWASTSHTYTRLWQNLRDVTPLYPLAEGTLNGTTAPLART